MKLVKKSEKLVTAGDETRLGGPTTIQKVVIDSASSTLIVAQVALLILDSHNSITMYR